MGKYQIEVGTQEGNETARITQESIWNMGQNRNENRTGTGTGTKLRQEY